MLQLYELRQQAGITQKQLARDLNMSAGNLCDWEKGRTEPDIAKLICLADYFDVSLDCLLGREEKETDGARLADVLKYRLLNAFQKMPKESREKLVEFLEIAFL